MRWWYIPLFYLGVAVAGYIWGMFKTLACNDWNKWCSNQSGEEK